MVDLLAELTAANLIAKEAYRADPTDANREAKHAAALELREFRYLKRGGPADEREEIEAKAREAKLNRRAERLIERHGLED